MPETTVQPAARIIAALLVSYGVKNVIVSPGTRNAPLIVALARQEGLTLHSIIDERTAGFVGLGMSGRLFEPVALVCTSGTAVLNYAPAIAEANYRNIPLIIVSADRPLRWIDQDDSQTIRQNGVLHQIVRGSFDISSDIDILDYEWTVKRTVCQAMLTAMGRPKGPVHINVRFDNPLGKLCDVVDTPNDILRNIQAISPTPRISRQDINLLGRSLINKKILIIVGTNPPDDRLTKSLKIISQNSQIGIIGEAQSNMRGVKCVGSADALLVSLTEQEKHELLPDVVFSIGGSVVSQSLKQWLRSCEKYEHWFLGAMRESELVDCFQHLTQVLDVDVPVFLSMLAGYLRKHSDKTMDYAAIWHNKYENLQRRVKQYISSIGWCDLKVVHGLFENLPPEVNLHLSNGMSIRYAQLSAYQRYHRVDCNRGCSGIEGSTSTAIGASIRSKRPTVLISGDMSARYDIGGMAVSNMADNFTMFVINNGGGDIFRVINNTRHLQEREEFMAVGTSDDFREIADAFGMQYFYIDNISELKKVCDKMRQHHSVPWFCEVDTRNVENAVQYQNLYKQLKENLL